MDWVVIVFLIVLLFMQAWLMCLQQQRHRAQMDKLDAIIRGIAELREGGTAP